ncbi:MAG TPA: hypothetical protein PK916_09010 [Bacteroidota bacterium]|nr:hypothetical protein [Bacteroidota bacterium]
MTNDAPPPTDHDLPPSQVYGAEPGEECVTPGNVASMLSMLRACDVNDPRAQVWIVSKLAAVEITDLSHLSRDVWRRMRDAWYPRWINNDWTPSPYIRNEIRRLLRQFTEDVLGQQSLF